MAMNPLRKMALKVLTLPVDLKKNYKLHRKFIIASHPFIKPLYHLSDRKIYLDGLEIPIRIFKTGEKNKIRKVILFFHGGGWISGNIDSYSVICRNMANQTGYTVVSVDYRLAPENPFPAGLSDCYEVAKQIFQDRQFMKVKSENIVIAGDSAGGNLAAAVSLMARDKGDFIPLKQILLYPATQSNYSEDTPFTSLRENGTGYLLTTKKMKDFMELYLGDKKDLQNPYVAPLLANDLSHQPKTLIITAEYDPLRDEGEAYGMRLEEFGNTVTVRRIPGALHGFLSLPKTSHSVIQAYEIINQFLQDGLLL